MSSIIGKCALSAALILSSFALVAPASAQSVQLRIGENGVHAVAGQPKRPPAPGCSPNQARAAAERQGLRRVQVARVNERSITVRGVTRRGVAQQLRFANRRGCPIL